MPVAEEPSHRELAERAASMLLDDIVHPPTLEELAASIGLTSFQLSRIFGAAMGRTIPGLVRYRRMERAAQLLRETQGSIGEIASSVGYRSMSAFCRGFEREMKMTPSEYRQSNKQTQTQALPGGMIGSGGWGNTKRWSAGHFKGAWTLLSAVSDALMHALFYLAARRSHRLLLRGGLSPSTRKSRLRHRTADRSVRAPLLSPSARFFTSLEKRKNPQAYMHTHTRAGASLPSWVLVALAAIRAGMRDSFMDHCLK